MIGTIAQWLAGIASRGDSNALRPVLNALGDRYSSVVFGSAGLVEKAGGSAIVKAGTAFHAIANGTLITKAANTDMAALSGTVTADAFNVYAFFVDSAGTLTSAMGIEGATLAAVKFPPLPEKKACIGFVVINPTGTGNFVGGTTALDDATVVPTAAYVNITGPFDPTVLLS